MTKFTRNLISWDKNIQINLQTTSYGEEEEDGTTLKKRLGKALAMKGKRMRMILKDGEGLCYGEEEDEDVTTLKKRLGKALAMKGKRMRMVLYLEEEVGEGLL